MDVQLLYFDGCPNWRIMDERLRALAEEIGFTIAYRAVETLEEAQKLGFRGSPTVLVDRRDLFPGDDGRVGLACRMYQTPEGLAGSPVLDELRAALSRR
ncbi:thioredoxin family protein [Phytoactinopolyspora mesophila]|uniref:Thioredoxin family protein n=1 Tax=Phytoactinopolyspora mesophila TaxID=2650750 RepID=A0A7K3M8G9_9ACTN|nr:thioredoxin family protein [Phytoactinopolyspora mesophila]NDL59480.1 thioredoxin family protein [Phytoactinopolyspora mesophila]